MPTHHFAPWFAGAFFILWLGFVLVGLGLTVFWIVELVDVVRREFPDSNTKLLWVLIVLLAHGIGALIYYFIGKPQGVLPGQSLPPRPHSPGNGPPGVGP